MNAVELLLLQFDLNGSDPWESIQSAVAKLTEADAQFQAPFYAKETKEPNLPSPGTVCWQLAHMTWCNLFYTEVLRHRPKKEIPDPPAPVITSLAQGLQALKDSHASLRNEVAKLNEADLQTLCGQSQITVAAFLSACLRHEVWHASQIALAKRLHGYFGSREK